jgi:hypothetical protein
MFNHNNKVKTINLDINNLIQEHNTDIDFENFYLKIYLYI